MKTFTGRLINRLQECSCCEWHDNFDEMRFGKLEENLARQTGRLVSSTLRRFGLHKPASLSRTALEEWEPLFTDLEWLYRKLIDDASRATLVDVIAYRILGHRHVRLKTNTTERRAWLDRIERIGDENDIIPLDFNGWNLNRFDLTSIGYPLKAYLRPNGVYVQFVLKQYFNDAIGIQVKKGDIVLDCGGCYGETSLLFAHHAGEDGQVFAFEFVRSNAEIFERAIKLNETLASRITLVDRALWNESGKPVFLRGSGPGANVSFTAANAQDSPISSTLTIDDFVAERSIAKLDFVKMDIEGAEYPALQGAVKTLQRDIPSLAICVYHSPNDFVRIAKAIDALDLGYRFALNHFTIHAEETVLYASR